MNSIFACQTTAPPALFFAVVLLLLPDFTRRRFAPLLDFAFFIITLIVIPVSFIHYRVITLYFYTITTLNTLRP